MSPIVLLFKSLVPAHTRRLKTGKVVNVRQYTDKRTKRLEDDKTLDMFADEDKDDLFSDAPEPVRNLSFTDYLKRGDAKGATDKLRGMSYQEAQEAALRAGFSMPHIPKDKRRDGSGVVAALADQLTRAAAQKTDGFGLRAKPKDDDTITTPRQEMIDEHKRLVDVLESPSRKDDKVEAKKQKEELEGYEERGESDAKSGMTPMDAAKYLKDVVYSLGNLEGMTDSAQLAMSSNLGKSGRDTLLMDAFNISREEAHDINNRLDERKPKKLRAVDMEDAFKIFPGLQGIIDQGIADGKRRDERRASLRAKPADDTPKIDAMIARAKALGFDGIGIKASLELYRNGKNPGQGVTSREEGIASLERMLAAAETKAKPRSRIIDPLTVNIFNPPEHGDTVRFPNYAEKTRDWTVKNEMHGWSLYRGSQRHPTIYNIPAMVDFIRALDGAAGAKTAELGGAETKAKPAPKVTAVTRGDVPPPDDDHPAPKMRASTSGLSDQDRARWLSLHQQQHEIHYHDRQKLGDQMDRVRSKRNKAETAMREAEAGLKGIRSAPVPDPEREREFSAAVDKARAEFDQYAKQLDTMASQHEILVEREEALGKQKNAILPGSGDLRMDLMSGSRISLVDEANRVKDYKLRYRDYFKNKPAKTPKVVSVKAA